MGVNNFKSVYNGVDLSEYATKQELDDATAAWSAGYTPKGPASVSTINGLTGQQNGDVYTLTDGGTVNPGALTVSEGEQIAWDAANSVWYKFTEYANKSELDSLSREVKENNIYKYKEKTKLTEVTATADDADTTGYKVYYNTVYHLLALQTSNYQQVHCFPVVAGKVYSVNNAYGQGDGVSNPYGVISEEKPSTISGAKTYKQILNTEEVGSPKKDSFLVEATVTGYMYINALNTETDFSVWECEAVTVKEVITPVINLNHWANKKIVWLGTSVPFGAGASTSYLKIIQDVLKFNLVPAIIPGQALHALYDNDSGLWYPKTYGSTCLSIAEYAAAKAAGLTSITIDNTPVFSWVPNSSYNSYYRAYDNVINADNSDADLWVFDVVPNNSNFDLDDFSGFDFSNWKYSDNSSFEDHRGTFLGAILFMLDKIYTLNPNARILLFLGSAFRYSEGKGNFEKLTEKGVELLDIWGDINWLKPSLSVIKQDGGNDNHPSTFGHEILGQRLIGRMLSVS